MQPEEIADILKQAFGGAVVDVVMGTGHPHVRVSAEAWPGIAMFLRDDERLGLNMLRCISGVDQIADGEIEVIYDLAALRARPEGGTWIAAHAFAVKVRVPREGGRVPTVSHVWPAADWHEREVYDLLGVRFEGHPDHRRILCPDDWVGHPLLKDYEYPLEYHGIPGTTEYGQMSPRH